MIKNRIESRPVVSQPVISAGQLGSLIRQHVRALIEADPGPDVETWGLPASIATALRAWVAQATDDELATVAGWAPEAPAALRRDRDR